MKKIIILVFFSTFTSQAFAEYSGILEYGVSGAENHSLTSSPKIGVLIDNNSWSTEVSWQHWFTTDGNSNFNQDSFTNYGNDIYSVVLYKNIFENNKYIFSFGGGASALEMERTELNKTKSHYKLLANISASASYKLTRATNLRISSGGNVSASNFNPLFGALNFGVNIKF